MSNILRSDFPLRPQTLYGQPLEIRDASDYYKERSSYHQPDIDIIDSQGLFRGDEVVIGIGRPNVFTLIPDIENTEGTEHLRFAAKSLKRAPSELQDTKARVQSSIFIILQGLTPEQIKRIYAVSKNHEGSKEITCVLANMKMLSDSGLKLGDKQNLQEIVWPGDCFKKIVTNGLYMDGQPVDYELLKTSRRYLESQVFQTKKSVAMTPFRHAERFFVKHGLLQKKVKRDAEDIVSPILAPTMKHENGHMSDITLTAAITPKVSRFFRRVWGAHGVLGIDQDRVDISDYLTEELRAYPDVNPGITTNIKKNFLFNKYVVGFINRFIQAGYTKFSGKTESDLHTLFETHTEERPCKYNVISGLNGSKLMKIDIQEGSVDWVLTKHVLISNYDTDIRFAGEVWKDQNGVIWVNRNSGTYQPTSQQLDNFIEYLRAIFPHVTFQADHSI